MNFAENSYLMEKVEESHTKKELPFSNMHHSDFFGPMSTEQDTCLCWLEILAHIGNQAVPADVSAAGLSAVALGMTLNQPGPSIDERFLA